MLTDLHMHTNCSPDGTHSAAEMANRAAELGIGCIALTDHCEIERYFSDGFASATRKAYAQAAATKAESPIEVLCGIEIGQPNANFALADRILAAQNYDYVLASLHNLPNTKPFFYLSNTPDEVDYLLNRYLDTMAEVVAWGNFDALAHLSYPLRYISGTFGHSVNWDNYAPKLDNILTQLARQGKALEINTAGLATSYGKVMPDLDILRRFRALSGQYVTVGSDAHSVDAVGSGIQAGIRLAHEAGFHAVCVFRNRKVHFVNE